MNRITHLLGIRYPIIQAGMIWCSGWKLAQAVSNSGGLGLIGSGSMHPDLLRDQVRKCKQATRNPFGVNVPLLYERNEDKFNILEEEGVKIVFTSAGNPEKWTQYLKGRGFTVVHVIANVKFAVKCQHAGVDAVVAEGFEAGGHNGKEETTTMVLIPQVREVVDFPLIAAGGIATGKAMLAVFALGAEGVQIGSRFVATPESSAHPAFKQKILEATDGDTMLALKRLGPVRLLKNKFFQKVSQMEDAGASAEELARLLGKGRAQKGMLEGDLDEGELEIGQVSGLIREMKPAGQIVSEIMEEFRTAKEQLTALRF
ncbi:MAG: nitronate monooxygenase [Bacteroidota bacterium]